MSLKIVIDTSYSYSSSELCYCDAMRCDVTEGANDNDDGDVNRASEKERKKE